MLILVISMPFDNWLCWGIHEQFEAFYWVKAFLHSSSWQTYYRSALLLFRSSLLLMMLVQNFQLINNHIKTWVWKSTETKLLTLKVLWDLDKTPQRNACWTPHHSLSMLKTIYNASDVKSPHMLRVKKSSNALFSRLKSGWRRETIKTKNKTSIQRASIFTKDALSKQLD